MSARYVASVLVAASAVGLVLGLVKGDGDQLRTAIGNLSAPWLLIALVPAWWSGSWWRGVVVGTVATTLGLVGFYAAMTIVLHGHLGGAHGWVPEFRYVLHANRIWIVAGLVSGPVLGALGGALGPGRRWLLGTLAGALMVAEMAVVGLLARVRLPVLGLSWAVESWGAYRGEAVLGALLVLASLLVGRRVVSSGLPGGE